MKEFLVMTKFLALTGRRALTELLVLMEFPALTWKNIFLTLQRLQGQFQRPTMIGGVVQNHPAAAPIRLVPAAPRLSEKSSRD